MIMSINHLAPHAVKYHDSAVFNIIISIKSNLKVESIENF